MVTFIITVGDLYEKKFSSAPPLTAVGPISCFLAVFFGELWGAGSGPFGFFSLFLLHLWHL